MAITLNIDPYIPVKIRDKEDGMAVAWIDYGGEEPLHWVVLTDVTKQYNIVPSPQVKILQGAEILLIDI
jgi:hypothetical protein